MGFSIPNMFGANTIAGGALAGTGLGISLANMAEGPSHSQYRDRGFDPQQSYYGGYEGGAQDISGMGMGQMGKSGGMANWANLQAQYAGLRAPRAYESQALSDNAAQARGVLGGAIGLASEAARGKAPSEAEQLMKAGLNQSVANQSALTGSARGSNAMALAQGNQGANVAAMQQNTLNQMGALRAKEMAEARSLYGGLAGQLSSADLNRLQQGNQMAQFNANLNDQYAVNMGQLGNQASQLGLGWYQAAQNPINQQFVADQAYQAQRQALYENQQARAFNQYQNVANESNDWTRGMIGFGGNLLGIGGSILGEAPASYNASTPVQGTSSAPNAVQPAPISYGSAANTMRPNTLNGAGYQ